MNGEPKIVFTPIYCELAERVLEVQPWTLRISAKSGEVNPAAVI